MNEESHLEKRKQDLLVSYRNTTQYAVNAFGYYQKFQRAEDWDGEGVQDCIEVFKNDSRRFLKELADKIKWLRSEIDKIDVRLEKLRK